jgi:hypothetical protein
VLERRHPAHRIRQTPAGGPQFRMELLAATLLSSSPPSLLLRQGNWKWLTGGRWPYLQSWRPHQQNVGSRLGKSNLRVLTKEFDRGNLLRTSALATVSDPKQNGL